MTLKWLIGGHNRFTVLSHKGFLESKAQEATVNNVNNGHNDVIGMSTEEIIMATIDKNRLLLDIWCFSAVL